MRARMTPEQKHDAAVQALQAVPATAAIVATKVLGFSLNEWLAIASIVFIVLQAGYLLWKWRNEWRARQRRREMGQDTDRGDL